MIVEYSRWKRRMKEEELHGKLRQKKKGGPFYYRLTVGTGVRKEFALKTKNRAEAIRAAADLDVVWEAPNKEVAFAQINALKGFTKQMVRLPLSEIWSKYEVHPDRAQPRSPHELLMYRATLQEFIDYSTGQIGIAGKKRRILSFISDVTPEVVSEYSDYLKTTRIAVDTHNRKMRRLRKIFECLKEYTGDLNPFRSKNIFRKAQEEQGHVVRRQAFTQEQEKALCAVLADKVHKVLNKPEIRVVYYLGMFTGQRMKDCVLLQWQNVDLNQRRIWVKQFKTGKEVTIPIAPQLYDVLVEAKEWEENQYVCPRLAERYNQKDANGKNIGNVKVNLDVLRVISWIGLETSVAVEGRDKKMTVYGFHSLRHSFCSFCAQANIPKAVLLSILGTDSEIADKYYTHVGDAAQQEAIMAISCFKGKTAQKKIDDVLALLNTKPEPTMELLDKIKRMLQEK